MSSADVLLDNYARGKQTFIIPLTFTDINDAKDIITDISYGGDIWEARIDLLSPDGPNIGAVNLPPLDYVRAQIKALQAMSALPILFTIRTRSQGGKFPDGASKEALALMETCFQLRQQALGEQDLYTQSSLNTLHIWLADCSNENL